MKLQGNVKGYMYPITQQEYEKPIDGTQRCSWCGRLFVPTRHQQKYCSHTCRSQAITSQKKSDYDREHARW